LPVLEEKNRSFVPFVSLFSDGASAQLLTDWCFPAIAHEWLQIGEPPDKQQPDDYHLLLESLGYRF